MVDSFVVTTASTFRIPMIYDFASSGIAMTTPYPDISDRIVLSSSSDATIPGPEYEPLSKSMSDPAHPAPKPKFRDISPTDYSSNFPSQKNHGIPSLWISLNNF